MERRRFLSGLGATVGACLLPQRGSANTSQFRIGQLTFGTSWNPRPNALGRLLWEIEKRTSITAAAAPSAVDLKSAKVRDTPYLYLAGDREFNVPPPAQIRKLRRFLTFGGFLHIDSAEGLVGGAFDRSVRRLVGELFPGRDEPLTIISRQHVVFKSFYLVEAPVGRIAMSSAMRGVEHDGRLILAYTENDLGGAWTRDDFGNFHYPCTPGGERQREVAFRFGVNLAMYALCLDYKSDQVHVRNILRRRRWKPEDGAEDLTSP